MGAMISRFVKIDNQYINLGSVTYVEVLHNGGCLIFTGSYTGDGEEVASITLEGEDARQFLAFLDKNVDDLTLTEEAL